jgi:hypothetical protein
MKEKRRSHKSQSSLITSSPQKSTEEGRAPIANFYVSFPSLLLLCQTDESESKSLLSDDDGDIVCGQSIN